MKWQQNYGTIISIFVSGITTAYAMIQPRMTQAELSLYGVTVVYRWFELIVAILIITWGYKLFKKINNIK